jgi:hypothetical protein
MSIYPKWTGTIHNSIYPDWLVSVGEVITTFVTYVNGIIYYRLK